MPVPQPEELRRRELPELFEALNYVLKKFKFKTGADDQYIYMVLGALMNEYKKKQKEAEMKFVAAMVQNIEREEFLDSL